MKLANIWVTSASLVALYCSVLPMACVSSATTPDETNRAETEKPEIVVDTAAVLSTVSPHAFGMHTSVYDNSLNSEYLTTRLPEAGIKLLRYPGGGYSDNYHWSTHTMTPWPDGNRGYLAAKSDFGNYASVLERTGTAAMITVNYGSNLDSNGPGEPAEAAAWVAYANGLPDDATVIGTDSTGRDWQTVGYWASIRAAAPLDVNDGYNFLRISRPLPLGIKYWEIGNEVFGNGFYVTDGGNGYELDLHLPYNATTAGLRRGDPALSPTTYGQGVVEYERAMRAVDPTIRVGAVLVTPPGDYSWGPNWNNDVLAVCGPSVDFVIVHYYPTGTANSIIDSPRTDIPQIFAELDKSISANAGANAGNVEVAVTEMGPNLSGATDPFGTGIFAAEAYVTFMEHGATNLDWLELHAGGFLNERNNDVGPAYHGIQMAHFFVQPGDTFVRTKATILGVVAHAAIHVDQSFSLLLSNLGTKARTGIPVTIAGPILASDGTRVDYQRLVDSTTVDGTIAGPVQITGLGNKFTVDLPPRTVSLISIPLAAPE